MTFKYFKFLLTTAMLLTSVTIFSQTLRNPAGWEKLYDKSLQSNFNFDEKLSKSGDSWDLYKLAYGLDSYNALFQATGNYKYLNESLSLINNVMNSSKLSYTFKHSQFKDNYYTWVNHSHEENGDDGKEYPLFESYFWRYVTTLLRIMHDSPKVMSSAIYLAQYNKILKFSEKNIFDKWYSRGKSHIYRSNAHMFSHWATICIDLWAITKKSKYKTIFDDFAKEMKGLFKPTHGGGIKWNVNAGLGAKMQDISHGNGVVVAIMESIECKYNAFSKNDLYKIYMVFNSLVFKQDRSAKSYKASLYLDGTDAHGRFVPPTISANFYDGFVKLGRYYKDLQLKFQTYTPETNSKYRRSLQFFANCTLNSVFLLKGRPAIQ